MFEKFGEMNYEELMRTAAAEKAEGDLEALIALAVENGMEKEDAEDYMDDLVDTLATPYMAAVARIEAQAKELKIEGRLKDQKDYIIQMLMEGGEVDEKMCLAVCRKGKYLKECLARILSYSSEHMTQIPEEIVKLAEFRRNGKKEKMRGPIYEGGGTKKDFKRIAREYYREA